MLLSPVHVYQHTFYIRMDQVFIMQNKHEKKMSFFFCSNEKKKVGYGENMSLTHCGLMTPEVWVNTGSGNGLLPDGTKPFPEPMLTYHQ